MNYDCDLCKALIEDNNLLIENTILAQSDNFVLLPTIGPLVEGHLAIVSKQHYGSLSQMGSDMIVEFQDFISSLDLDKKLGNNILFTEHGSFNDQTGGACVIHTHIHIIPDFGQCYNILDTLLPIIKIGNILEILNINIPYILNFNSKNEIRLYSAYNSFSQMMRKAICNKYGRTDSDWKAQRKNDLIQESVEMWKKLC